MIRVQAGNEFPATGLDFATVACRWLLMSLHIISHRDEAT